MNVMRETLLEKVADIEHGIQGRRGAGRWDMRFHIMPPVGWLNDPNGLCFYRGKYYFFFQYAPFDPQGGLKMWGLYTSTDLLHWDYQGTPLLPDSPYDCHGVYSGSALAADGKLEIFYTGNIKLDGDYDYITSGREANVIYTSSQDGRTFGKKECLLNSKDYPEDYTCHIRDPKVWKQDGEYYMVLGGRKRDDRGAVLIYQSRDKKEWRFLRELTTQQPFGYMWECPDLFQLDGYWVLSVSPQGLEREEYRFQNIYEAGYFLPESLQEGVEEAEFREWDMGFDFYAPQTFIDGKGRRILTAWAGLPDIQQEYTNPTVEMGWQHVLTTPRQLTWKDGQICQYPVAECDQLRGEKIPLARNSETVIEEECFDLEITELDSADCTVKIEEECVLTFKEGVFQLGFTGRLGSGRTERKAKIDKLSCLRVLADASLLEIYINGGETVFTTRYYPDGSCRKIGFYGSRGQGSLWELENK